MFIGAALLWCQCYSRQQSTFSIAQSHFLKIYVVGYHFVPWDEENLLHNGDYQQVVLIFLKTFKNNWSRGEDESSKLESSRIRIIFIMLKLI